MNVLVAFEESGAVRDAMIGRGHNAWSCDLLPGRGRYIGRHLRMDIVDLLSVDLREIRRGRLADVNHWDLIIAFPPCTYLCSSGLHWNKRRPERAALTADALDMVRYLMALPIDAIAIENPIGCISTEIRPPDQIIHPHQFGHDASKATCLWLKNLPPLRATNVLAPNRYRCNAGHIFDRALGDHGCPICRDGGQARALWGNQTDSGQNKLPPSRLRARMRSETYSGIAAAMADQWPRALQ